MKHFIIFSLFHRFERVWAQTWFFQSHSHHERSHWRSTRACLERFEDTNRKSNLGFINNVVIDRKLKCLWTVKRDPKHIYAATECIFSFDGFSIAEYLIYEE